MSKNEYKAAAKVTFAGILSAIEAGLAGIARVEEEAARKAAVFEVQVGMALDSARIEFAAAKSVGVSLAKTAGIGTDDWRVFARENVPGKSNGTLYRWQNAGHVAKVLGDSLVPGTLVTGLATLYRGLNAAKTDEEREAAESLVREVYAEACEAAGTDEDGNPIAPTFEDLKARAEAAFPTNRSGGGGKNAAGETLTDDDEDEDESDEDESDSRRESGGPTVASPEFAAAVEAAAGPTDAILRGLVRELSVTREAAVAVALATLRLAEEHGVTVVRSVLAGGTGGPEDEAADESADESDS